MAGTMKSGNFGAETTGTGMTFVAHPLTSSIAAAAVTRSAFRIQCPVTVIRDISPGRGIPAGGVAPRSNIPDDSRYSHSSAFVRRSRELRRDPSVALAEAGRALPAGRRAPGFMPPIMVTGHSEKFTSPRGPGDRSGGAV